MRIFNFLEDVCRWQVFAKCHTDVGIVTGVNRLFEIGDILYRLFKPINRVGLFLQVLRDFYRLGNQGALQFIDVRLLTLITLPMSYELKIREDPVWFLLLASEAVSVDLFFIIWHLIYQFRLACHSLDNLLIKNQPSFHNPFGFGIGTMIIRRWR